MLTQNGVTYFTISDRVGNFLDAVTDFSFMQYAKTVNNVGTMVANVPMSYLPIIRLYNQVQIFRSPKGSTEYLELDALWIILKYRLVIDQSGNKYIEITCFEANFILEGRDAAYYSGTANTTMSGLAGDLMKTIVSQNVASAANDFTTTANTTVGTLPAKGIPTTYFAVEGNRGDGASVSLDFSFRDVLSVLQDLASASYFAGTYMAFDLVNDSNSHLTFKTFQGQRGADRRVSSAGTSLLAPMILDPFFNNVSNASLAFDATSQYSFIYALGPQSGSSRIIGRSYSVSGVSTGPFSRREKTVTAGQATNQTNANQIAALSVMDSKPAIVYDGTINDSPQTVYGVHWRFGDFVTCQFFGTQADCRLDQIKVSLDGKSSTETVNVQLRSVA